MDGTNGPGTFLSLIPYFIVSSMMAVSAYFLAKDKGRPVALWTVLALIPFVNFIFMSYAMGASNLRLEQKIDQLLTALQKGR